MADRSPELIIEHLSVDEPKPDPNNPRKHSPAQLRRLAAGIAKYGFVVPILVDQSDRVIAGHGRLAAAKREGMATVPAIRIEHLSAEQVRAFRLFDNKIAEESDWDFDLLAQEFQALIDLDFEITDTGFEMAEIDLILGEPEGDLSKPEIFDADCDGPPIAQPGDRFLCGPHRLLCADARDAGAYAALMDGQVARGTFTDPPYNVPIANNVSSTGRHGEFAMGSGEMDHATFAAFLSQCSALMAAHCAPGALIYQCIDWRHVDVMIEAGRSTIGPLINIAVWDKGNAGMGSPYRSAHELICVFKNGKGRHRDNVQLGRHGRSRSNIWRYPGLAGFGKGRQRALALHPTVKPVAMIADAILDCTGRGDIVLDPFAGSGTILIAAHRTGRVARAMEISPDYVDVALRRFRRETGIEPVHAESGLTLAELEARSAETADGQADAVEVMS